MLPWVALLVLAPTRDPAALGAEDPPRVRVARAQNAEAIKTLFEDAHVPYPAAGILLRVFKLDDVVELWVQPKKKAPFVLLETYPICARSGSAGPKREEGDGQVPEGFYRVSAFNPTSNFLLSMRVNYPNEADRRRNTAPRLGGDIYIHGACVTIGCVPLGDEVISKLYVIAQDAAQAGAPVAVHVFPTRLDDAHRPALEAAAGRDKSLIAFWDELRPGYAWFETKRSLPPVKVDPKGRYVFPSD